MSITIKNPERTMIKKWGELAYITEEERNRILALPFGEFKPACKRLRKAIEEMKKKEKAK